MTYLQITGKKMLQNLDQHPRKSLWRQLLHQLFCLPLSKQIFVLFINKVTTVRTP